HRALGLEAVPRGLERVLGHRHAAQRVPLDGADALAAHLEPRLVVLLHRVLQRAARHAQRAEHVRHVAPARGALLTPRLVRSVPEQPRELVARLVVPFVLAHDRLSVAGQGNARSRPWNSLVWMGYRRW